MLNKYEGKVHSYRAVSRHTVQIELVGLSKLVELTVLEPWVINKGDQIIVAGEEENKTGKFRAYAYRNETKNVHGVYRVSFAELVLPFIFGFAFIFYIIGIVGFIWGVYSWIKRQKCKESFKLVTSKRRIEPKL